MAFACSIQSSQFCVYEFDCRFVGLQIPSATAVLDKR